jgi:soluble lytic murein transglycosylase-like protein
MSIKGKAITISMKKYIFIVLFFCCIYNFIPGGAVNSYQTSKEIFSVTSILDNWEQTEDDPYLWRIPYEYRGIVVNASSQFDIPIKYLYRLIKIESQFKENAIRYENNGTYSVGMTQINSSNFEYFEEKFNDGNKINYNDPYQSIYIGAAYLRYLNNKLEGDWINTFASYQWGIGNVLKNKGEFPDIVKDYSYTIYYGYEYIPNVKIIKCAVKGII